MKQNFKIAIIFCISLVGCTRDYEILPYQESALLYIEGYVDLNIMSGVPSHDSLDTKIVWVHDTCTTINGIEVTGFLYENNCVGGVYYGSNEIFVAINDEPFSDTALVHEALHRIRVAMGLGVDGQHTDMDWWGEVTSIRNALKNRGW